MLEKSVLKRYFIFELFRSGAYETKNDFRSLTQLILNLIGPILNFIWLTILHVFNLC